MLLFALNAFEANHGNTVWAKRTAFARSAITPPKVNQFDEIWNIVSLMLGAGCGRFWAQSVQ